MKYDYYDNINTMNNIMPNYNYYKSTNNNSNLLNPGEAYKLGNSFKNEYVGYKNYKVKMPIIKSEQEEMLYNFGQYAFIAHDLNLYLDINPDDKVYLNKFLEYKNKAEELKKEYERKYGPLCVSDQTNTNHFNWIDDWTLVK